MRPTFPLIALATGAGLPSALRAEHVVLASGTAVPGAQHARARADKLKAGLPPRLEEDIRIVGALAEFFATAAAERLLKAGPTRGSDAMRPTLPFIALATGAALCTGLLAPEASPRPDQGSIGRRTLRSPERGGVGSAGHQRARGAGLPRSPRGQAPARALRAVDAAAWVDASSSSPSTRRPSES